MKPSLTSRLLAFLALAASTSAQLAPTPSIPPPTNKEKDIVKLSDFSVSAENDNEYRAANTTSGTRYSTPIKDLPMNIEVLTSAFMRDIGALDQTPSLPGTARRPTRFRRGAVKSKLLTDRNDLNTWNDLATNPGAVGEMVTYTDNFSVTSVTSAFTLSVCGNQIFQPPF